MAKAAIPTIAFTEPLTSPPRVHHASTLAELLVMAGTRKRIVEAWEVSARTYDTRKRSPGTSTVGELQQLARAGTAGVGGVGPRHVQVSVRS